MKGTYRNPRQRHADTVRSEARAQALNNRLAMVASSTSATLAASQARMAQLRAGGALTWQVPSPAPAPSAIAGAVFAAPVPPPNYTAPAPYVPPPAPAPAPAPYVPAPAPAPAKVPSGIRRIYDSSEILPASGRQEDDEVMPLPSEVRARRPPPTPAARRPRPRRRATAARPPFSLYPSRPAGSARARCRRA